MSFQVVLVGSQEASPAFQFIKVPHDQCATGNPCVGINSCDKCQTAMNATNATICSWYVSTTPSVYNSKCDVNKPGLVDTALYTQTLGSCPSCTGTTCLDCNTDSSCRWVAVQLLTTLAFGECLSNSTPSLKTNITTCPTTCQLHSCAACTVVPACSWFTGSTLFNEICDLTSDGKLQHPAQHPLTPPCGACKADRCFECNSEAGCGWYAHTAGPLVLEQGCYPTNNFPLGRVLLGNSDSKCKGVPSRSSHLAASFGFLAFLIVI